MSTIHKRFHRYWSTLSDTERQAIADACDVSVYSLRNICYTRGVGPELAVRLERATNGALSRKYLFPDNYKAIWPELD